MRVIQERNGGNTPTVTYTRGSDLSNNRVRERLPIRVRVVGAFAVFSGLTGAVLPLLDLIYSDYAGNHLGTRLYYAAAFIAIVAHLYLIAEGWMLLRRHQGALLSYFFGLETIYFCSFAFVFPELVSSGRVSELDVRRILTISGGFTVQMLCLFPLWGWLILRRERNSGPQT